MKNKELVTFVLITAMAVSLLGCGNAKAGTVSDTDIATEANTGSDTEEQKEQIPEEAPENAAESATSTPDSSASANNGLRDLYAMETYDTVPEELLEEHDDVDYGTIDEDVEYYSTTAGDNKHCNVLLPAGYDESQEYPVLYMIHGWGGSYDSHVYDGSALQILYGNMLNEGLTVPMIIVGVDMYTDPLADKDSKSEEEMRLSYDRPSEHSRLRCFPGRDDLSCHRFQMAVQNSIHRKPRSRPRRHSHPLLRGNLLELADF